MAEAAVNLLLKKVKEVVEHHKDLIFGAENDFELLNKDLDEIKVFLEDVAKKTNKGNRFREVERQVTDVVYEVDDTIDIYLTSRIQAKPSNSGRPALPDSLRISLNSIREEKLLPMFDDVKVKFARMQIADGFEAVEDLQNNLTKEIPIRQIRVVGHEDEEETIRSYLIEETKDLDVISIVGAPGQGKTTLAWKIYQSKFICYHFPIRIWVCISQKLNIRDVFLHILRKFIHSQETSDLKDDDLALTVRACLEEKKLFLVLDDLWSIDDWNRIKEVIPLSNGKCKVLITSRQLDVGMHCPEYRRGHQLRLLTKEESWELLQYEVFGNLEDCPEELKGIGKHIATKCDGVPLTIVVIGGILMDQFRRSLSMSKAEEEWETVSKNVSDAMLNDKEHRITNIVSLSYDRLPGYLRECFLYMGVFPEDYEFRVEMLFELWIAEGFIVPKNGRSLEEIARESLNDLIQRNLLKVEKTNHMGKVKTCRVHDMIRAFCITKSKEENLFQEIKRSKMGVVVHSISELQKLNRLCFHSDLSMFLSEKPNGPQVRSFLCFYEQRLEMEPQYASVIPNGFCKLRILESRSIKFHQFPAKVTKLIHLRYLTLFIDNLKILPEPISYLWNLQTLTVETNCQYITMKANMRRMIQLRHLKTNAVLVLESIWEGKAGENLQTLDRLSPESCTIAVSARTKNLKTLGIYGALAKVFKTTFLEELYSLENLKLVNTLVYESKFEDYETKSKDPPLNSLPQWNHFPPNLKRLTLRNTFLNWRHMSTLSMIKHLEVLKLKDNAFVGESWKVAYNFCNLQLLLVVNTDLVFWEASTDNFPCLRFLVVENCESLKEIPECLGTYLEKLEIERLSGSAVQSAKKIEEAKKGKPKAKFAVQFDLSIGPGCETN